MDLKPKEQTKAITYKQDHYYDKTSTSKEIYDEILEERIDDILINNNIRKSEV